MLSSKREPSVQSATTVYTSDCSSGCRVAHSTLDSRTDCTRAHALRTSGSASSALHTAALRWSARAAMACDRLSGPSSFAERTVGGSRAPTETQSRSAVLLNRIGRLLLKIWAAMTVTKLQAKVVSDN